MHQTLRRTVGKRPSLGLTIKRRFGNFTPFNKYSQGGMLDQENDPKLDEAARHLFDNVLLVRKTPKYDRLKDSPLIQHPYIRDVLLNNW